MMSSQALHRPSDPADPVGEAHVAAADRPRSEAAVDHPGWQAAARRLLQAVGAPPELAAVQTLAQFDQGLRGSGFELRQVRVVNDALPPVDGMVGGLVELAQGGWGSLLGGHDEVRLLGGHEEARLLDGHDETRLLDGHDEARLRGGHDEARLRRGAPEIDLPAAGAERGLDERRGTRFELGTARRVWVLCERSTDLRSVLPFLRRHRAQFLSLFAAAMIVNLLALTLPLFSSFVYDKILGNGIVETMWALVIGLLLVTGIEFSVRVLRIGVAERFAVGSEMDIDHSTFRNLLATSANKMPAIGSLLEKYKQILSYRDLLSSSYVLALADLPFLLLFLFAIMVEAGPLALVAVVCGTVMILVSLALTPPALDYDRSARAAGERRFGLIADLLSSREAVVGGALQERLAERWRQASATAAHGASQARYWRGLAGSFNSSLSYVSFIAVLVGGAYMIEDHTLTSGGLLAASMLTSRAMGMFGSAITLLTRYREFRIALRELNQLVPVSAATRRTRDYGRLRGAVRVEHVTCRLRPDVKPVLREVDFAIGAGEIVGIAGAPGAGKTSLLRMLVGVVIPEEGRILIDDIPIERLSPSDLSLNVGFKPQEYGLFDGTVEDNVRAGRGALTAETRADVLAVSGLHRAFEDGSLNWTTEVGARGGNLSGGQRQLVALARALLTRPPLILLDEPTNGLDSALEAHLAAQLRRLRGASTIIVSTHSRNLLQICDRIIVVGQSKLLANGPRDQILV